MCLIAFNWANHPVYQLILVGNRDEFFNRPTSALHLWPSGFYGGKDLKGGGTWMGFHKNGKFASLTNYRDWTAPKINPISRGHLVKDFLEGGEQPMEYLHTVKRKMGQYEGFNLLVAEGDNMVYLSNHREEPEIVLPGVHAISNAFLDSPWPKVEQAKQEMKDTIADKELNESCLIKLLQSKSYAPDEQLPKTGVSLEMERMLSAQFIQMGKEYGTVNTTAILWKKTGEVIIKERLTASLEETLVEFKIDSGKN